MTRSRKNPTVVTALTNRLVSESADLVRGLNLVVLVGDVCAL